MQMQMQMPPCVPSRSAVWDLVRGCAGYRDLRVGFRLRHDSMNERIALWRSGLWVCLGIQFVYLAQVI